MENALLMTHKKIKDSEYKAPNLFLNKYIEEYALKQVTKK